MKPGRFALFIILHCVLVLELLSRHHLQKNVDKSKIELSQRYQRKQLEDKFLLHRDDGLLPLIEVVLHNNIPKKSLNQQHRIKLKVSLKPTRT